MSDSAAAASAPAPGFDVDVVIVAHNAGPLLEPAVASAAREAGEDRMVVVDAASTDALAADEPPSLSALLDRFWRAGPELAGLHVSPLAAEAPDALLRQLGPAPVDFGDQNLAELLGRAYVQLASAAERRALAE